MVNSPLRGLIYRGVALGGISWESTVPPIIMEVKNVCVSNMYDNTFQIQPFSTSMIVGWVVPPPSKSGNESRTLKFYNPGGDWHPGRGDNSG